METTDTEKLYEAVLTAYRLLDIERRRTQALLDLLIERKVIDFTAFSLAFDQLSHDELGMPDASMRAQLDGWLRKTRATVQ